MYKVDLSKRAQEFYRKAERPLAHKLARCFQQLEQDPRDHPNIKPLTGKLAGHYRYRVGDYRAIYRIDDRQQVVFILKIAHRSDVYD